MKKFLISFLLSLSVLQAGAWTKKKGNGFYQAEYRFFSASKLYNSDGDKIEIPSLSRHSFNLYGEYGVTDWLTATLGFSALHFVKSEVPVAGEEDKSGFGDINIGARLKLLKSGPFFLSGVIKLGIPTGDSEPAGGLVTGDGEFNQYIGLSAGWSFYPANMWANLSAGFNNRTEGFSDEFFAAAEYGYKASDKFTIILRLSTLRSLNNGEKNVTGGYAGLGSSNVQYIAYGPQIVYNLNKKWSLYISADTGTAGKNIFAAPAFAFGAWLRM